MPRFATIALAGRPNAGKSTLLNALVGEPLAAVSPKPQMTREPVYGIVTDGDTQLLFIDPPGLFEPSYPLQEAMRVAALDALERADALVYLHPITDGPPPPFESVLPADVRLDAPVRTCLSKGDGAERHAAHETAEEAGAEPSHVLVVSATTGRGLDDLLAWCRAQAPEREFRYDPEDISTQPLRHFAAEYVREAAFQTLGEELPYAVAAEVDEFREAEDPVYIRVSIYVEKKSQKGMVIGGGGRTIRAIGTAARRRIEALLGRRVYLDLWVKILPKWRKSPDALRRFGFDMPAKRKL